MSLLRQYELIDKIAELEKQITTYKKELTCLQYKSWDHNHGVTFTCSKCDVDRTKDACPLSNKMECAIMGTAQTGDFK